MSSRHSCSVIGCRDQDKNLFVLPSGDSDLRNRWITFIFDGSVPIAPGSYLFVCAIHFPPDSFTNLGQYNAGLAKKLRLEKGVVPSIRDPQLVGSPSHRASSLEFPTSVDVACLTDVPDRRTVCTQLSFRTLHPHYRSLGVQATVSCRDVGVGTSDAFNFSTAERRASKRHRLDSEDELELEYDPLEDSYVTSKGTHSVTALTEPTNSSEQSSAPVPNGKKHLVFESCLLQLFAECPVCERRCDVETEEKENFLSVKQRCPRCPFFRHWNSRPVHGHTAAGDSLQH